MTDLGSSPPSRLGLERVALDLHVHTPASGDWREGDVAPEAIIEQVVQRGLDGIAVTDHESGQFIDKLRAAAAPHGITIIPGVEINNLAGNEGIHLIALFSPP